MKLTLKTKKRIAQEFIIVVVVLVTWIAVVIMLSLTAKPDYLGVLFLVGMFYTFVLIYLIRSIVWSIKTLKQKEED